MSLPGVTIGDVTVVTWGTGFVGAAVVRQLVAAGHRIRVLARPGSNRRLLVDLPIEIVDGDFRPDACRRPEYVAKTKRSCTTGH